MRRFLTTRRHEQVPSCLTGRGRRGTTVNSCLPSCALFLRFVSVASCSLPSFATFGHTTKNGSYMALWAGTLRTQLGLDSADSAELGLYGLSGLYSFVGRSATRGLRCIFEMWGDGGGLVGCASPLLTLSCSSTLAQLKPLFSSSPAFSSSAVLLCSCRSCMARKVSSWCFLRAAGELRAARLRGRRRNLQLVRG
jgi:hypothetical protein